MIELSNVKIVAGSFSLADIDFSIGQGEYAILMGRTGSGKTTIVETICGLRPVISGTILLDGRDVTELSPADRNIGYVSQDLALFDTMTVEENLRFGPSIRRQPQKSIDQKICELAKLLDIKNLLSRRTQKLSGGEAQRVALGRALAFQPSVLILDEPLSALDESTRNQMYDVLKRVQQQTGVTTLHVTHSSIEAEVLGTKILVLKDGTVSCQ